jgi:CBS domain-containing protein
LRARKTLLVAGAAAGMTAIFGTPVSAVLLAIELLLFEWKPRSFVPVAAAAITAAILRPFLLGYGPLFPYHTLVAIPYWGLALCAVAGCVSGLQAALLSVTLFRMEELFGRLPFHWMWWPALGAVAVGIGGYIDPAALSVGYDNIRALLQDNLDMQTAGLLLVVKTTIWIIALSSGTSGSVFAPLLIMGGALGALESHYLPFGDAGFWALLGMAAILSGALRAPLTSTVFAVELTGNLHMFPASLTASIASFAVTALLLRRSILTERMARRGQHVPREYAVDPLLYARVDQVMAKPVDTLAAPMTVEEAVAFFMSADGPHRHKSYPILSPDGRLAGIVSRADILRWSREGWPAEATLGSLQKSDHLITGYDDESVADLADRMSAADVGRVPIVERATGKLVGLVARRDLFRVRARALRDEQERQKLLRLA